MSALDSNVALLVAALDLKVVQLIRDAIRVTDLAGAAERGTVGPAATIEPRRHYVPTPVIEPRRHVRPEPVYEARPVIHLPQRYVEPPAAMCPPADPAPSCPHAKPPLLLPPWKTLPWENPPQPALKIKVIKLRPDIVRKGSLVDLFF